MSTGAVLAALALVAAGGASPTMAGPPNAASSAVPGLSRLAAGAKQTDVTLITGDIVHVGVAADGTYSTRTDLAPRPDGRRVAVQNLVDAEHVYVLPSDAAALVAAGQVDRRLFDVRQLIADGYADATAATLPVIVAYAGKAPRARTPQEHAKVKADLRARAGTLPATASGRALESVNGVSMAVTKKKAARFWSTVDPVATAKSLGAGLSRLWLDGKVHASLDQSVPMIGAPQAWSAGLDGSGVTVAILDTGIDATHPDLAGKVADSRSFVPGVSAVTDGNGHGTHVASTIAGSGAASGARYKGVAPGAKLVIGKVLNDAGSGDEAWIIDGMEWAAATEGARVISMSLGSSGASDGSDPMSQAVDTLTASTGALFVIAAGNSGPSPRTVAAPGAADAALTVAAVTKSDQLAAFSSRGPRAADYAVKPEIAAPGVDIVAARAAGTSLGSPVNSYYTTLSGTSMATPHVAGSAAILVQEHPDWTAQQLKAALMGTAKDDGYSVYEQGAGRVDVAAAYRATVVPVTAKVDFGRIRYPQTGPALSKTLTYRNTGTAPVTLALSAGLATESGGAAPGGMLTVSPSSVVVPAGGTADVAVTLDPTAGTAGLYSGAVTASGTGVSLRTPVGAYKEPQGFDLSVRVIGPDGAVAQVQGPVIIRRTDRDTGEWIILSPASAADVHLDKGVYSVDTVMVWSDSPGDLNNEAVLVNPQVDLSKDTTVTLDTGKAKKIEFAADRATDVYGTTLNVWQIPAGSNSPFGVVSGQVPYGVQPWALPTQPVSVGRFFFDHSHVIGTPLITAAAASGDSLTLHPRYQHYSAKIPKLDGRVELPVVDAGSGSAADFAKVDVKGKIALIGIGDRGLANGLGYDFAQQELLNAAAAGATAVFAFPNAGRPVMGSYLPGLARDYPLPTLGIPAQEGFALRARLGRGPATLRVDSQPTIPDLYTLSYLDQGAVPDALRYTVADRDLATVRPSYHGDRPITVSEKWFARRPGILDVDNFAASFSVLSMDDLPGPMTHTEHLGPVSSSAIWYRSADTYDRQRWLALDLGHQIQFFLAHIQTADILDKPITRSEVWGQSPTVPGMVIPPSAVAAKMGTDTTFCAVCRFSGLLADGDLLPILPVTVDGEGKGSELTTYSNNSLNPERSGVDEWHLYGNGTELPQNSLVGVPGMFPYYVLPQGQADYRLTEHFENWLLQGGYGNKVDTTWTFTSRTPTSKELAREYDALGMCVDACRVEPLLFLRYQFDLRPDNRSAAPGVQTFTVTAYRQPSAGAMPPVAGMKLSASFDGGSHWTDVPVTPLGDGQYHVSLVQPIGGQTGTVTVRTEAWDTAGNRISQTLFDAYGLVDAER